MTKKLTPARLAEATEYVKRWAERGDEVHGHGYILKGHTRALLAHIAALEAENERMTRKIVELEDGFDASEKEIDSLNEETRELRSEVDRVKQEARDGE